MVWWDKVVNVLGSIPLVGTVTAGVQYAAGDKDGAQKSLAASTGNLLATAGAVGGFMVGGPGGAAAGGAAGHAVGGQIERKINGQDLDLSLAKLATDALVGGATAMIPGAGGLVGGIGQSAGIAVSSTVGTQVIAQTGVQIAK